MWGAASTIGIIIALAGVILGLSGSRLESRRLSSAKALARRIGELRKEGRVAVFCLYHRQSGLDQLVSETVAAYEDAVPNVEFFSPDFSGKGQAAKQDKLLTELLFALGLSRNELPVLILAHPLMAWNSLGYYAAKPGAPVPGVIVSTNKEQIVQDLDFLFGGAQSVDSDLDASMTYIQLGERMRVLRKMNWRWTLVARIRKHAPGFFRAMGQVYLNSLK